MLVPLSLRRGAGPLLARRHLELLSALSVIFKAVPDDEGADRPEDDVRVRAFTDPVHNDENRVDYTHANAQKEATPP